MNAITQLDVLDLEDTIARYGVGDLIRYWPAVNGIENSNYFLRTTQDGREREFVLTIIEQPSNSGGAYVPLLDLCVRDGLPVAEVVRTLTGQPYDTFNGKSVILSQRLPGRHVYNPTQLQVEALGRFTARFHNTTANWDFPVPPYPRDGRWLAESAAASRHYLPFEASQLLDETLVNVLSLLGRNDIRQLPTGIVHGDLFRDNLLFNERGLTGVLDFHHAARGYLIYDLAVAANDWCTDSTGVLDTERTTALLRAYHAIRPVTAAEIRFFPMFALYAALSFWLSRLAVAPRRDESGNVRFNNPEEFQRIVQHHCAHFFYLDERLLLG